VNTRDSLGFPQDRHEVPLATGIAGSPNGGRGSDLTILSGIWTHASRRLLLNAQQSTHSSQLLLFSKFRLHFYHLICRTLCRGQAVPWWARSKELIADVLLRLNIRV